MSGITIANICNLLLKSEGLYIHPGPCQIVTNIKVHRKRQSLSNSYKSVWFNFDIISPNQLIFVYS